MAGEELSGEPGYGQGLRDGVAIVVRGLLAVEADQVDVGALIGSLSRLEDEIEAWRDAGEETGAKGPPSWSPTPEDLGVEPEEG